MTDTSPDQADLDLLLQSPQQWPNYNNYQPLDPSHRQIRVLTIWHDKIRDQIHGSMMHKSLDEDFEYDALSYYWGPPDQQRPIYVEGQPVLIRRSLHSFLDVLCHHGQGRPVWLDSICINQRDVKERNSQVAMMGDVYRNATCVKAWIGEADADLEYAFAYLSNRTDPRLRNSEHASAVKKRARSSLQQVLSRPYWQRLWIIQEVGLAKRATILAGKRSVDLEELVDFGAHELGLTDTFLYSLSRLRQWIALEELVDFTSPNATIHRRTAEFGELKEDWLSSQTILGRMSAFGNHLCENPRDKIFGLLSLSTDESSIEVTYEKTLGEIVLQILHDLVERHARIVGDGGSSPYILPMDEFHDMVQFASGAVRQSSFGVDDLTDFRNYAGHELCCGIKSMAAPIYGNLTPAFSGNDGVCIFRKWKGDRSKVHKRINQMPHPPPTPWYSSISSSNDTNFYERTFHPLSTEYKLVCLYIGDHEPDPARCRFFRIDLTPNRQNPNSTFKRSAPAQTMDFDYVTLLVEFEEEGPRVAGVLVSQDWAELRFEPVGLMTTTDILAVLLLEEEVQVCTRVIFDDNQGWNDGKMQLRLHCSHVSFMTMLAARAYGLDETTIRVIVEKRRAVHPKMRLCDCKYQAEENLKHHHLVRRTNFEEFCESLKQETKDEQDFLTDQVDFLELRLKMKSNAELPQGFDVSRYVDISSEDESNEDVVKSREYSWETEVGKEARRLCRVPRIIELHDRRPT